MYARKRPVVGIIPFALPGLTGLCIGLTYWVFRFSATQIGTLVTVTESGSRIEIEGAWLCPTMQYKLIGAKALKGIGFGTSIGFGSTDFLRRSRNGRTETVPLNDYEDVFSFCGHPPAAPSSFSGFCKRGLLSVLGASGTHSTGSRPTVHHPGLMAKLGGDCF